MSSERWSQISELFHAALEKDPEDRNAFLKDACGVDEALESEVRSLLTAHIKAGDFIQAPAVKNVLETLSQDEETLNIGQQIGAYKIVRQIGRGGMGAVYLAERADQQYEKHAALKLVKRGMDTDYVLGHFRKERQILANFEHPNIARLLDGGSTESGLPYFVMEFVEGSPINEYCDSHRLSITKRLELFCRVCEAVAYAHRHMVIHRDIKPSNILVTTEGMPKLLDFGIAKVLEAEAGEATATATGMRIMTPEYASPEQALGLPMTTLSDVYSLGVVLYELLTGYPPYQFKSRSVLDMARVITETEPPMPSTRIITKVEDRAVDRAAESVSQLREGTPDRLRKRLLGDIDNIVLMALRKEPQRRYQSVEQFSEDIRRHLSGLPVVARKDTLTYRSTKFVRRNRLAVAAAAFAITALILSASIGIVIQWRANQQARFLQEFGAEAARMESIMRFAYLLPLHDVTTEQKLVEARMESIRARMAELGSAAAGPGNYALARGFMALQKYPEAGKQFRSAIEQFDYRTPEIAYSYGLTLAMLYQSELESAARIASAEQREIRMKEIQRDFKNPALAFIQEGRKAAEYSEYAEALMEFLDERFENAISRSERTLQKVPWFYESARLEGDSYRLMGREFLDKGNFPEASEAFKKAEAAYKKSVQKGNSDPSNYVGLCNLRSSVLSLQIQKGGEVESAYRLGEEECQKALIADHRHVDTFLALASLHTQWIRHEYLYRGAQPALQKAIQAAHSATQLEKDNPRTHWALGQAYFWLADYQYINQTDPGAAIRDAQLSFEKAIRLNPNDGNSYYYLGQLFQTASQYLIDHGGDPRESLDQSQKYLRESVRLNPKSYRPLNVMGSVLTTRAEFETENGLDASRSFDAALLAFQQSLKINPNNVNTHTNIGYSLLAKAEYQVACGQDPLSALKEAEEAFHRTLQIRPGYAYALRSLAQLEWRLAEYSLTIGEAPSPHLKKGEEYLERIWAEDPNDWTAYPIRGEIELAAGRAKMLAGESPVREFQNALSWFRRGEEIIKSTEIFDIWYSRTRVYRWWTEWDLQSKIPCDQEVARGLEMAARALQLNPRSGEIMGLRGVLLLLQARSSKDPEGRRELAERARVSFEKALKTNANVTHTYAPFLKEAETLKR